MRIASSSASITAADNGHQRAALITSPSVGQPIGAVGAPAKAFVISAGSMRATVGEVTVRTDSLKPNRILREEDSESSAPNGMVVSRTRPHAALAQAKSVPIRPESRISAASRQAPTPSSLTATSPNPTGSLAAITNSRQKEPSRFVSRLECTNLSMPSPAERVGLQLEQRPVPLAGNRLDEWNGLLRFPRIDRECQNRPYRITCQQAVPLYNEGISVVSA